jgi:hypothetical protein
VFLSFHSERSPTGFTTSVATASEAFGAYLRGSAYRLSEGVAARISSLKGCTSS